MKNYIKFSLLLAFITLSGCMGTSAIIKPVEDLKVDSLKNSETSKPIQFQKIVIKLKRGEHIGAWKAGFLCVPNGDLNWKGGKLNIDSDEFTETFKEELEKYSFKTVGDTNALFEDPSTWKSEILVAGLVKELKANICYPMAGFGNFNNSKGEAFLKVDWQIYSKLDRSVVHTVSTEGSFTSTSASDNGGDTVVLNAFSQAARNLLADSKFREVVSRGGQSVKETEIKKGDYSSISIKKSKPMGNSPKEWSSAVVTVFAGGGHGSGFVISDNLILTNHHVAGNANSATVKLENGIEIIGKVIASNSARDVALIKVDASMPKYFKTKKELPAVGSEVYAVGSPLDESFSSTMSKGIVSAIREENKLKFIQSDVNIRPGNSGGPMVNKDGEVIGIAVSAFVVNGQGQGLNFFIPIADALKTLKIE
jgi:S1-C subfamily serine protease